MTGKNLKQVESLACTKNRTRELNTLASSRISRHCTRSKLLASCKWKRSIKARSLHSHSPY